MAEMVHRILPSRRIFGNLPLIFVGNEAPEPTGGFDTLPPFLQEVLRLLELLPEEVTVLRQNHLVERLHIVEAASDLGTGPKPAYWPYIDAFMASRLERLFPAATRSDRVYVSRSRLTARGGMLGEPYVDAVLRQDGWQIFHPEQHPVAVQMDVYRRARVLVFSEGSACHGTELLGRGDLGTCLLLVRRPDHLTTFRRILEPRAKQFAAFTDTIDVGTIVHEPRSGMPLQNLGVSLFNLARLENFLRLHEAIRDGTFDRRAYQAAATEDFEHYVAHYKPEPAGLQLHGVEACRNRLHALLEV